MRILFYLPLMRGWAFENMISPMIAKVSGHAEVHVMLSSDWLDRAGEMARAASPQYRDVVWHAMDKGDEAGGADSAALSATVLERARAIDPDYSLCRSVNPDLPDCLPGRVGFIMEASIPPFAVPRHWITIEPQLFRHGSMPDLSVQERRAIADLIAPGWAKLQKQYRRRSSWMRCKGLPPERKIVALPLEYDNSTNSFGVHRCIRPNHRLVASIADRTPGPLLLAVTDHPMNDRLESNHALRDVVSRYAQKVRLVPPDRVPGQVTNRLARHAEGMVVGDSKSFATAVFFGKPIYRMSKFASAPWLCSYDRLEDFAADLTRDRACTADREDAMTWFGFYLANGAFGPRDGDVDGTEILGRICRPFDPQRWSGAFRRYAHVQPDLFAPRS